MPRNFNTPPSREEIPILRRQIYTQHEVATAILSTAHVMAERRGDSPITVITVNEGARFFSSGIKNARRAIAPEFNPPVYEVSVKRTNTDSTFREPEIEQGLPEDLDLSDSAVWIEDDVVDEGKTLGKAIIPHAEAHGAKLENISLWALLVRARKFVNIEDPELYETVIRMLHAALVINSDGFVFGSHIDDERLRRYPRYAHDAGRGEKGIWENDPIESAAA